MSAREWATAAEKAVCERHLTRLWGLPGTAIGRTGWPPSLQQRMHWHWNYWWQAHFLDCLVDAELRDPQPQRRKLMKKFARTIWLRNAGKWTNNYYDDMAWLGLSLHRAKTVTGVNFDKPINIILDQLHGAWTTDAGGGIWWRRGDQFKNAPANGPAAILHARSGELSRSRELNSWMENTLVDPESGVVWDGFRVDTGKLEKFIYTYCQGVFLGSCVELSEMDSAARTIRAIDSFCAPEKVIRGQNGGDGGLFGGILARYLAIAAKEITDNAASSVAREIVMESAKACWNGANNSPKYPIFHSQWSDHAPEIPLPKEHPDRDLSVQLGAWMLLEAAASLE